MLTARAVAAQAVVLKPGRAHSNAQRVLVRVGKTHAAGEVFPGPQEEKAEAHEAFLHAFEASRPIAAAIPGLQQFAAGVWERRRRIPSTTYNDPLDHIFTEFDEDGDGHLTAEEISKALRSRGVEASPDQVQLYIQATDDNNNGMVERSEFTNFIFQMAVADLKRMGSVDAP
eukprot:gene11035-11190_t